MRSRKLVVLCIGVLSVLTWTSVSRVQSAHAVGMKEAFEALRFVEDDFINTGTICEHVAKLEVQKSYPEARFDTWVGVTYRVGQEVIGELDLVVRDRSLQKVVLVGEVKCWRNLPAGLEKAQEQEARFRETLAEQQRLGEPVEFVKFLSQGKTVEFDSSEFDAKVDYIAIAQNGSRRIGFDQELELGLEELMELRKQILSKRDPR